MPREEQGLGEKVPCCPILEKAPSCESLDFRYRLPMRYGRVQAEVTLHFRLTRCAGPLALGDLVYSTTLLPGETVRLFTSDRHSRFTYDSESRLAYRNETTSEESYYAAGMAAAMSDLQQFESSSRLASFTEASVSGGGSAGIDIPLLGSIGASASASAYSSLTVEAMARSLSRHAESASRHVEVSTRAMSSMSMGEVQSRTHTQTESQDHFESSSRAFANPNRCHAVTYFFYRIDKIQQLVFELVAIERRVVDPAAPTRVQMNQPDRTHKVAVLPAGIIATSNLRQQVVQVDRAQAAKPAAPQVQARVVAAGRRPQARVAEAPAAAPVPEQEQTAVLTKLDGELQNRGLIDKTGKPTAAILESLGWKRTVALPTPGVLVRGCLDDCETCEPARKREIELELERKKLQNQLLARQIEMLDKAQEYRCCPAGETEAGGAP